MRSETSTRRLRLACVAAGLTIVIVVVLVWWNERGLGSVAERLAAGDAAGALAAADSYLLDHPAHSQALALRARALVALGRVDEGAQIFRQIGAADTADLRAWSMALLQLGDWPQALSILQRLHQLDPSDPKPLENITICQFEMGHEQEAIENAQRLAEIPGHEAAGNLQIASIYRAGGHASLANRHYEQVLHFRPDASGLEIPAAEILFNYGDSLLMSSDARRALEQLERGHKLAPTPGNLLRQGEAWQLLGNYARAREVLEDVIRQDSNNRVARERLAETALQQNDPQTALRWLQDLIDHRWITSSAAYLLQRAHTALNHESEAEEWQAQAVALRRTERLLAALHLAEREHPDSPRARLVRAYQAAADGEWPAASKTLGALLRQTPDCYTDPFVQQLVEAIRKRGPLPPVESLPDRSWVSNGNPDQRPAASNPRLP